MRKLLVRPLGVGTDADDFSTGLLKDFITIAKRARLSGTTSSIILEELDTCKNYVIPNTRGPPLHNGNGCHDPPIPFGLGTTPTCFSREVGNLIVIRQ